MPYTNPVMKITLMIVNMKASANCNENNINVTKVLLVEGINSQI